MPRIFHQTEQLTPDDEDRLFWLAAVIYYHFLKRHAWKPVMTRDGSFTLQHKIENHHVIKLLVDHDHRLVARLNVPAAVRANIPEDPLIVGIEVEHYDPFLQDAIRNKLTADAGGFYLNPHHGGTQVELIPNRFDHCYDVLILRQASCPYEVTDEMIAAIRQDADQPDWSDLPPIEELVS